MQDFLFFKGEKNYFKLRFLEILFIQADKRHTAVVTADKTFVALASITDIEKFLPGHLFCKVHRSYIVAIGHIDMFDNEIVYIGKKKIPLSEQYKSRLKNSITIVNSDLRQFKLDNDDVDKLLSNLNP